MQLVIQFSRTVFSREVSCKVPQLERASLPCLGTLGAPLQLPTQGCPWIKAVPLNQDREPKLTGGAEHEQMLLADFQGLSVRLSREGRSRQLGAGGTRSAARLGMLVLPQAPTGCPK